MSPSMVRTTSAMGASSNRKELGAPSGGGTGLAAPITWSLPRMMRGSNTASGPGAEGGSAGGGGFPAAPTTQPLSQAQAGKGQSRVEKGGGGMGGVFACRQYHGACQQGTGGNGQTLCEHGVMAHEFTTLGLGEILARPVLRCAAQGAPVRPLGVLALA